MADSPPHPQVVNCLDLLRHVVAVPCPGMTATVALDWYKTPEEGVDPRYWSNTTVGALIKRAKYLFKYDPDRQDEIGRLIVGGLVAVIEVHPLYAAADSILGVPGHDRSQLSFGARIAPTLHDVLGLELISVRQRDPYRPEMKNLDPAAQAAALRGQFRVVGDLAGRTTIGADDVLRSGSSMRALAAAARAAGATRTLGLAAVRTMRA